jgi:large subunit ribosomal protein L25
MSGSPGDPRALPATSPILGGGGFLSGESSVARHGYFAVSDLVHEIRKKLAGDLPAMTQPAKVFGTSMSELLHVDQRKTHGKLNNRRLRRVGQLPAVLYGHGEEPISLTLSAEQFETSLRHGAKVLDLEGAATGKALLQDVQWDTFFKHVLHVDLLRVVAGEKVKIDVPVELRGEAPGLLNGGIIEQMIHSLEIEVPLDVVPDRLHLNVNRLEIGAELCVKDIEDLPPGATILADPDEMIVHCIQPAAEEEEGAGEEGVVAEPEVIGKGKEDEEEGEK